MDWANVGGYLNIRALKLVRTVYMCPLMIPRGRARFVCKITHLYPYPTLGLMFINDVIFFMGGLDPFPPPTLVMKSYLLPYPSLH